MVYTMSLEKPGKRVYTRGPERVYVIEAPDLREKRVSTVVVYVLFFPALAMTPLAVCIARVLSLFWGSVPKGAYCKLNGPCDNVRRMLQAKLLCRGYRGTLIRASHEI